jgi:cation-transporting ATPase I
VVALHRLVSSSRPHGRLTPRASQVGGHVHVRLRRVWPDQAGPFLAALTDALADLPVMWVDVRLLEGNLVVAVDDGGWERAVVDAVEAAEIKAGIDINPFPEHRHGAPVEDEPLLRAAVEVCADVAAFGLGLTLRALHVPRLPIELDVEVVASLVQNVPGLRRTLARWVGRAAAETGAGVAAALTQGLAQNLLGPVVGCAYHTLRLGELRARQEAWLEAEPWLYGPDTVTSVPTEQAERPVPRPPGPVERYAEMTWVASLGTFVATLPLSGNMERALSVLATGAPKAARLGREAFASHLGRDLGRRGIVVMRPGSLRLLDQIDVVVVEGRLWAGEDAAALARVVAANGLELVVAGAPPRRRRQCPDATSPPVVPAVDGPGEVRRLQIAGRVVATVGGPTFGPLSAGDLALGVTGRDGRAPDGSHVICLEGLPDATRVLGACLPARQASRESARLSLAGAVVASLLAAAPVMGAGARLPRVLTAIDAAALVAVGNGVRHARQVKMDDARPEPPQVPGVPAGEAMALGPVSSGHDGQRG